MKNLKLSLFILIITTLLFFIAQYLSINNQIPVDGPLTSGFPYVFYTEPSTFGCITMDSAECVTYINYEVLLLNYVIHLFITLVVYFVYLKRRIFAKTTQYKKFTNRLLHDFQHKFLFSFILGVVINSVGILTMPKNEFAIDAAPKYIFEILLLPFIIWGIIRNALNSDVVTENNYYLFIDFISGALGVIVSLTIYYLIIHFIYQLILKNKHGSKQS